MCILYLQNVIFSALLLALSVKLPPRLVHFISLDFMLLWRSWQALGPHRFCGGKSKGLWFVKEPVKSFCFEVCSHGGKELQSFFFSFFFFFEDWKVQAKEKYLLQVAYFGKVKTEAFLWSAHIWSVLSWK